MSERTGQTILIVDDDPEFLEAIASTLREFGHRVACEGSAQGAITALQQNAPSAVLIDSTLAGQGGIALCRTMRTLREGRDIPIILIASEGEDRVRLEGLAAGADDYLERPFQPQELRVRVEVHLRERAQRRSLKRAYERLEAINELGMLLSSSLQAEDPYGAAASAIAEEFGVELAAIGILRSAALELRALSPARAYDRAREILDREGARQALRTGLQSFSVEGVERICWAPIRDREGALGVLALLSHRADTFSDEDARAISTICSQLALAFRNQDFVMKMRANSERLESMVRERTETLERQIRFTGQIIDSLPVSLYVLDRHRTIVAWNRQRELGNQGLMRDKAIGRSLFDVFDQQDREAMEAELQPVFERGQSLVFERDSSADGDLRHFRIRKLPMRLEPGEVTHVLTIGEDITEQKRMQKSMVVTEKMAAMGRLASGVAHEINNPLATIVTCAGGLRNRLGEMPVPENLTAEFTEYLEIVEQEAYRAKRITEDLLDFSRVRPSARRAQSLEKILDRTLLILKHHAGFKRIEVERHFAQTLPPIAVEEDAIVQVFVALIINALDAMPEGGRLSLSTAAAHDEVRCEVRDSGCGIVQPDLIRIFEPFFTTKPIGRGTGLGLAVCYGIMQSHQGRIEVESTVGEGSRFTVIFPAVSAAADSEEGTLACNQPQPSGS